MALCIWEISCVFDIWIWPSRKSCAGATLRAEVCSFLINDAGAPPRDMKNECVSWILVSCVCVKDWRCAILWIQRCIYGIFGLRLTRNTVYVCVFVCVCVCVYVCVCVWCRKVAMLHPADGAAIRFIDFWVSVCKEVINVAILGVKGWSIWQFLSLCSQES